MRGAQKGAKLLGKEENKVSQKKKKLPKKQGYTMKLVKRNWELYLFIIPTLVYLILFNYAPIYGLLMAFKNFKFSKGIMGSDWVGLKWFIKFFESPRFWLLIENTLKLSIYSLIVGFPLPVILALILNNVKNKKWKKFAQTITYMPHFISTVVLVSMINLFFAPKTGIVNYVLAALGGSGSTYFMGSEKYFPHMYVWSGVWQGVGWSSIIYLSALAGVDQQLHEAAMIDGANKWKRLLHIDLPSIAPTVIITLIMSCGSILGVGWEKTYLMQNDLNMATSEVISTYVYRVGMIQFDYSYSTAIGLFNSVVNFILLVLVNQISRKVSDTSLW